MALNAFDLVKALPHGEDTVGMLEKSLTRWQYRPSLQDEGLKAVLEKTPVFQDAPVIRAEESPVTAADIRRQSGMRRMNTEMGFYAAAIVVGAFAVYMAGLPMFDPPTQNDIADKMHELAGVLSELSSMARAVGYSY